MLSICHHGHLSVSGGAVRISHAHIYFGRFVPVISTSISRLCLENRPAGEKV